MEYKDIKLIYGPQIIKEKINIEHLIDVNLFLGNTGTRSSHGILSDFAISDLYNMVLIHKGINLDISNKKYIPLKKPNTDCKWRYSYDNTNNILKKSQCNMEISGGDMFDYNDYHFERLMYYKHSHLVALGW